MTIRVIIQNTEQRKIDGKHVNATLDVTLIEGVIKDGHVSEQRTIVQIEPGCSQEFSVYAMRSLLLSASNKP